MSKLMKGHTFAKGKHKLNYPAVAEIKLDEIRCDVHLTRNRETQCEPSELGRRVFTRSYADKPLANTGHWDRGFSELMNDLEIGRIDCGILVNRSYNDSYRWVRSTKGLPEDLRKPNTLVEFVLFDIPQFNSPYSERRFQVDAIAQAGRHYGIPFIRPERVDVFCEEDVHVAFDQARARNFEGLMVKDLSHVYELDKRIYGWLKVKPEDDADGRITAVNRAYSIQGEPLDRAGSVSVECEDGSICDVPGIAHDLGRLMLAHPEKFIGEWCEFSYMERDRQGGYRHPRFNRIREAKA